MKAPSLLTLTIPLLALSLFAGGCAADTDVTGEEQAETVSELRSKKKKKKKTAKKKSSATTKKKSKTAKAEWAAGGGGTWDEDLGDDIVDEGIGYASVDADPVGE